MLDLNKIEWREESRRILDSALNLHLGGLSIFPLTHPIAHRGESEAGKKPMVKWSEFQTRRPTDREVRSWFEDLRGPRDLRNIGIALGPISGCIVIDVDAQGALGALRDDGYPDPLKYVQTARGEHWYYGWDEQHPIGNKAKITVGGAQISGLGMSPEQVQSALSQHTDYQNRQIQQALIGANL